MVPKIFMTGGTGYVGGDALVHMLSAHPDWDITCSVRNSDKGAKIAAVFPHVKLVYGDLDSAEMLEEESSKADIVFNFADSDHQPSAEAIVRGMARRQAPGPGYLIHTSGTMILTWEDFREQSWGEPRSKVYDDWEGINELISFPDDADHRPIDKVVLAASHNFPGKINTAIVCPPTIYGKGRGPDNQRSAQIPLTTEKFLQFQQAAVIGKGENVWHQVHVKDLAQLYLLLAEAAINGGPPATWNDQGYYLAENGSFVWGEVLTAIAKEAHAQGVLPSSDLKRLSGDEFVDMYQFEYAKAAIATDARGQSIRARKLLGWNPQERSVMEEIPFAVTEEARLLGLIKSHAEKVAQ